MPKQKILCRAVSRQTAGTTKINHFSAFIDWNSTKLEMQTPIGLSTMPKQKILFHAMSRQSPGTAKIKHISAFND